MDLRLSVTVSGVLHIAHLQPIPGLIALRIASAYFKELESLNVFFLSACDWFKTSKKIVPFPFPCGHVVVPTVSRTCLSRPASEAIIRYRKSFSAEVHLQKLST